MLRGEQMAYFNYHCKIKNLIQENHLISAEIVDDWNGIKPAMVFYFDNNKPMPIREYRFLEYYEFLKKHNVQVQVKE